MFRRVFAILYVSSVILASSLSAVPLTFKMDPEDSLRLFAGQPASAIAAPEAAASPIKSGDTAYLLCTESSYQFTSYGGTDCWGWRSSSTGLEIAVMGTYDAIKFVNPVTQTVTSSIPAPTGCGSAFWRDFKSYKNVVYATSECSGTNQGLMVMSMNGITGQATLVRVVPVDNFGYYWSHNLSIDTINGFAYLESENVAGRSIAIHSLAADPLNPVWINNFGPGDVHDVLATDDTVYVAEGWLAGFSIYNLANKMSPVLITRIAVPTGGYLHNIWPSPDRKYAATTEETANHTIKIWDIQNLSNIQLIGEYIGGSGLAHNVHYGGDTLYVSHYESGLTVVDCTDPSNPVQIGQIDTWNTETPNFNGCWGAFPFTQSGRIYASNMDGKFVIATQEIATPVGKMWADTAFALGGSKVEVNIHMSSNTSIHKVIIPFDWTGPYAMTLDSFSRAGTMINNWVVSQTLVYDLLEDRMCLSYTSSNNGSVPDLPAGSSGIILKLFFSVPEGATGESNPITLPVMNTSAYPRIVRDNCLSFAADTASGMVLTGSGSCCIGTRGNVNGDAGQSVNIIDITFLVNYLFKSGLPPQCPEEANVNGDAGNSVNILDLTHLVNYLFKSGPPPASCP